MSLRKAILILGRVSRWTRTEVRELTFTEFLSYSVSALEIMKERIPDDSF